MRCYRIMSDSHFKNPFSSSSSSGRWNPTGARMIYAAHLPSLALLEYLTIKGSAVSTKLWYMVEFEITDETLIGDLEAKNLPTEWNSLPHTKATQDFGKQWLDDKEFPFLKVPSSRLSLSFYPL